MKVAIVGASRRFSLRFVKKVIDLKTLCFVCLDFRLQK